MLKFKLSEDMLFDEDKKLCNNFRKYRDYNTIRRNLREAYDLVNYIIKVQSDILSAGTINGYESEVNLIKIKWHYLIILYARWFNATGGKPSLDKNNFFKGDKEYLLETHEYIFELRNKYVAHNEKELLGGDSVFVNIDEHGEIKITSEWKEKNIPDTETLSNVKQCIEVVHNKIDAEIIPKHEVYLEETIKQDPSLLSSIIENLIGRIKP